MAEAKHTDLAVVILNWNGVAFLQKFLPSVVEYSKPYRVVVADNASTDSSLAYVKEHFPQVELVVNASNGGFAKGYNDALKRIKASYYILLNSDIEVSPNWIEPLVEVMKNNDVAGCQPKILSFSDKSRFEHAGASGGFLDKDFYPFCRGRIFEETEVDELQYNTNEEIFWATGACMLIRAELYHAVGGLDEDFFAHMEEIDLCWRLKRIGYTFMVVPSSKVYHVGGGTLNYMHPKKTYLNFRNSLYMIAKNYEGWVGGKIFRRLCLDGLAAIRFTLNGQLTHLKALVKAHIDFYKQWKKLKQKRAQFESNNIIRFNKKGLYTKSILWSHFVQKKKVFSKLDASDFENQ